MDNEIRKKSKEKYANALRACQIFLVTEIKECSQLPIIDLTKNQYESGLWKIPRVYEDVVISAVTLVMLHHHYEVSRSQLLYAFLEAAEQTGKLRIDGELLK